MRSVLYLVIFLGLQTAAAQSVSLSESFTSSSKKSSSSLIWNNGLGTLHPPMIVDDYQVSFGAFQDATVEFGDGRHGEFGLSTFENFGTVVGSTIYLDTSTYPFLYVTRFELPAGYDLVPTGNQPLRIHSLADVIVNGRILCSGSAGASPSGAGRTNSGTGGLGACGGGDGGAGGAPFVFGSAGSGNGQAGTTRNAFVTAGAGGVYAGAGGTGFGTGSGGGGGGAFSSLGSSAPGDNGTHSTGGASGSNLIDDAFVNAGGGAGGGGGSGNGGTVTPTSPEAGAGGGAGGGVIEIFAVRHLEVGAAGHILAVGGNGGSSVGLGGPGGAGGGGSIRIWVGGEIRLYNNSVNPRAIDARRGTPGAVGAVDGGSGYDGRVWLDLGNVIVNPTNYYPVEGATLTALGQYRFLTTLLEAETKAYDLRSTLPDVTAMTVNPGSGDISVQFQAALKDDFSDGTGWLPLTSYDQLDRKRFVKFKFSLTNSSPTNPTMIQDLQVDYVPGTQTQFDFQGSGCGTISTPPAAEDSSRAWFFLLLLIPLGVLTFLRLRLWSSHEI
ncbi:MAG: hypothetical protein ACK5P6_06025 [Pseudobdellovibrionaceae bacterium]